MGTHRNTVGLLLLLATVAHAQQQATSTPVAAKPVKVFFRGPFAEGSGPHFVKFSPDGSMLIGTSVGSAFVWDFKTGNLIQEVWGDVMNAATRAVVLDADRIAIVWSVGPEVSIHDIKSGKELQRWKVNSRAGPMSLHPSAGGNDLIIDAGIIDTWDTRTGTKKSTFGEVLLPQPRNDVQQRKGHRSSALVDGGKRLCVADGLGSWREFDVATNQPIGDTHRIPEGTVQFTADGKTLAVFSDGVMTIIDAATDKADALALPDLGDLEKAITSATIAPDGKTAAVQKEDRTYLLDITQSPAKLLHEMRQQDSFGRAHLWSPDGQRLLGLGGRRMDDWDLKTGKRTYVDLVHDGDVFGSDVSPDGKEIISCDSHGRVVRWSIADGKVLASSPETEGKVEDVGIYHAWAIGDEVLTVNTGGWFAWLDKATLKTVRKEKLFPERTGVFTMAADASVIAGWPRDGTTINFFNGKSLAKVGEMPAAAPDLVDMCMNRDGSLLVQASPKQIFITDRQTNKQLMTLAAPTEPGQPNSGEVRVVALSPDERYLIARGSFGIAAWDRTALKPDIDNLPKWTSQLRSIYLPYFRATDAFVLVPQEGVVRILERETGQQVCALAVPVRAQPATMVPNSSLIVVSGPPRFIAMYDLKSVLLDPDAAVEDERLDADLWAKTAGNASEAYPAALELARRGALVPRVRAWLEQTAKQRENAKRARELISQLDSNESKAREAAHRDLERLGPAMISEARTALVSATGEKRDRLESILRLFEDVAPTAAAVDGRLPRVREVLRWSKPTSAEDQELLKTLTGL